MNAPAWTPGPWRTEIDNVFAGLIDNSTYVADCAPMGGPVEGRSDQIANANLIAAAPDLYAALDIMMRCAAITGVTIGDMDASRAALSKARGQS